MGRRLQLHELLLTLCERAYFQPPANVSMVYPCIVYGFGSIDNQHAGNLPYRTNTRYQVTVIDGDPDSEIRDNLAMLPLCSFDRHIKVDNLNHYVFNLYF